MRHAINGLLFTVCYFARGTLMMLAFPFIAIYELITGVEWALFNSGELEMLEEQERKEVNRNGRSE